MKVNSEVQLGCALVEGANVPPGGTTEAVWWWWVRAAVTPAVCAATVGGNALVLSAVRGAAPRAPAHYLLASLAAADLLLGVSVLPLAVARELYSFHLERGWCACWSTLDVLCCTASILSLSALGWERHEGVTRPLARARRAARARLVALLVWPMSAAVAAPAAFVPSPRPHAASGRACSVNTNIGYVMFSMTFSFYLPAAAMVLLYWRVLRALRSTPPLRAHRGGSREPPSPVPSPLRVPRVGCREPPSPLRVPRAGCRLPPSPVPLHEPLTQVSLALTSLGKFCSPGQNIREENAANVFLSPKGRHLGLPSLSYLGDMLTCSRTPSPSVEAEVGARSQSLQVRATRTIVLLMSLFLLCWTPFFIVLPMDAVCGCVPRAAWSCATWLGYANSALNPLVYACTSPAVRRALRLTTTTTSSATTTASDARTAPAAAARGSFISLVSTTV